MRSSFAHSPEFERLLEGGGGTNLFRIALEIARDAYPEVDAGSYLARIKALAGRIRERCPRGLKPRQVLGQINWVLFVEEGYQGNSDDYYDPRNSYLNEVIDRKMGIPISLSVLYWTVAEELGLVLAGVNLPIHFMLRLGESEETVFIDPFHAGALLDRQGCAKTIGELARQPITLTDVQLSPCGHETVVCRMLRNLKAIYLKEHDFPAALPVVRRLAALSRNDPEEQRDFGMLCLEMARPAEALTPLQSYLDSLPTPEDAEPVKALLLAARRDVALRN